MNDYELLYIVSGGLTEAESTKVTDEVGQSLLKLGGKASDENVWGRRALAYPIGKDDHGWYVVARFAMDPAKVDEFAKSLNLNRKVIRTVLVKASEVPTPEEAKKAQEATEQAEQDEAEARAAAKKGGVKAKARPADAAPSETAAEVPEELKKTAAKPAVQKAEAASEAESSDVGEAKPADDATRQKQLDEKLGEILKD